MYRKMPASGPIGNHSFDVHLNSLGPVSSFSPSWTSSGYVVGGAGFGLMRATSFVYGYGRWHFSSTEAFLWTSCYHLKSGISNIRYDSYLKASVKDQTTHVTMLSIPEWVKQVLPSRSVQLKTVTKSFRWSLAHLCDVTVYFQLLHITKRAFCNVVSRAISHPAFNIPHWKLTSETLNTFHQMITFKAHFEYFASFSLSWNSHSFSLPDVSAYIFLSWSNFIIDL